MGKAAGNGTEAAILAGYSKGAARGQSSRLLTKAHIRAAIDERAKSDSAVWDRAARQRFWTDVAKGLYADASMGHRLTASELLGKTQADFIDRVEHAGPDGGPMQMTVMFGGRYKPHVPAEGR